MLDYYVIFSTFFRWSRFQVLKSHENSKACKCFINRSTKLVKEIDSKFVWIIWCQVTGKRSHLLSRICIHTPCCHHRLAQDYILQIKHYNLSKYTQRLPYPSITFNYFQAKFHISLGHETVLAKITLFKSGKGQADFTFEQEYVV